MSQMSDRKFLVMIIVLTWNNFKDTAECLQSLQKIDYPNYRVVLIDNGSEDDSINKIRLLYPELTIIETKRTSDMLVGIMSALNMLLQKGQNISSY